MHDLTPDRAVRHKHHLIRSTLFTLAFLSCGYTASNSVLRHGARQRPARAPDLENPMDSAFDGILDGTPTHGILLDAVVGTLEAGRSESRSGGPWPTTEDREWWRRQSAPAVGSRMGLRLFVSTDVPVPADDTADTTSSSKRHCRLANTGMLPRYRLMGRKYPAGMTVSLSRFRRTMARRAPPRKHRSAPTRHSVPIFRVSFLMPPAAAHHWRRGGSQAFVRMGLLARPYLPRFPRRSTQRGRR